MKLLIGAVLLLVSLAGAPAMGLLAVTAAAFTPLTAQQCDRADPGCATDTTSVLVPPDSPASLCSAR